MAAPKRSSFGTRLLMNFLTYHGIYLKICDNWKWKQAVVGQSDSRFCTNMKKNGYFLACTAVVMLKIEARPGCTRTKGYISRKQRRTKKVTSKLEQGLNFTVNGDFWFCNDDFWKKSLKAGNRIFVVVLWRLKRSFLLWSCPNSKGNILQRALFASIQDIPIWRAFYYSQCSSWQSRQCSRDWKSCNVLGSVVLYCQFWPAGPSMG